MAVDDYVRNSKGRFAKLVCVNAHDRCYEGGPCPYCEPREVYPTPTPSGTRPAHRIEEE